MTTLGPLSKTMNRLQRHQHSAGHREPLRDLVGRVDLPSLVEQYAGPGRRSGSASFTYCCPNPQHPDRHPSFTVSRDPQGRWWAACWSQCAWHGDALALVQWLTGCDVRTAADRLRAFMGIHEYPDTWQPPAVKQRPAAPVIERRALPAHTPTPDALVCSEVMGKYLAHRQWPESVVQQFGLSVVTTQGVPAVRHPFYVLNADGVPEVDTWQDRLHLQGRKGSKWVAATGRPLPLYNMPALSMPDLAAVVICEGPADTVSATVALQSAAFPRIVAVGVAGARGWRSEWAPLFADMTVLVAADNDEAGHKLRRDIEADLLPIASELWHLQLPPDVNDLTDWCRRKGSAGVGEQLGKVLRAHAEPTAHDHLTRAMQLLTDAGITHTLETER